MGLFTGIMLGCPGSNIKFTSQHFIYEIKTGIQAQLNCLCLPSIPQTSNSRILSTYKLFFFINFIYFLKKFLVLRRQHQIPTTRLSENSQPTHKLNGYGISYSSNKSGQVALLQTLGIQKRNGTQFRPLGYMMKYPV